MRKRFVVALDSTMPGQPAALNEYFKEKKVGWWHWLSNLWLVTDSSGQLTAAEIRDTIATLLPGVTSLVIEFRSDGDTWAGFGPKTAEKDMFKWIRENWKKPPDSI